MTTSITVSDYRALAELRHRIRRFLEFSEHAAHEAGVEPQQHQLLLALKGLAPDERPTIGVLAERLCIRHQSAVELVTRSELRGLVRRKKSDGDRREVAVELTARGEKILERLSVAHKNELRTAAPLLARALDALVAKTPAKKRVSGATTKKKPGARAA